MYPPPHHHDPSVFGADCEVFRHDRFTGADGARLEKDHLMPFGGGISQCPGRKFARNEIKAFVASLIGCCEFRLAPGQPALLPEPNIDGSRVGLGVFAPAQDVRVQIRPLRHAAK